MEGFACSRGSPPPLRSGFGFWVLGLGFRVSVVGCFWFWNFGFRVSIVGCRGLGVGCRGWGVECLWVSCFGSRVSIIGRRVPGVGGRVWVSGFGCRVSSSSVRVKVGSS